MKLYQQERDMAEMQRWALVTAFDAVGVAWNRWTGLGQGAGQGAGVEMGTGAEEVPESAFIPAFPVNKAAYPQTITF